ncbi:hypothetical protein RQP46_007831 [Phenoliferia psychrophenolica]
MSGTEGSMLVKPDYSLPNAYRPIALLCCLGKGLEKLVATRLGYLAEFAGLLPPEHFGGRPGRSCEDTLHVVVDTIKTQWRLGNYVVAILLDVKGAYPNTTSARLQANLRRRGVPEEIVAFVASFMEDRTCRIILEGEISPLMPSDCGLPQGSPLSPILYLFYKADLLAALRTPHSTPTGWVDDTAVIVYGPDPSEVSRHANLLMGRVETWCGGHDSDMDAAKSHVIPLPRPSVRSRTLPPPPIFLNSIPIPISEHAVLLGVTLDSTLSFHHHVSAAVAKASKAIGGITRLVTSTKGISAKFTRQLVVGCAYTRSDYASTLWYTPDRAKGLVKELTKIQRPALKLITGGFRNTALSALEYESFLLPTNLRLLRRSFRFAARLRTISPSHPLFDRVQLLLLTPPSTYRSPLSITLHSFPSLSLVVPIEQLRPSAVSPWEPNPQPPTFVAESKDIALQHQASAVAAAHPSSLLLYSDGSLLHGHVGSGLALQSLQGFGGGRLQSALPIVRPNNINSLIRPDDLLTRPLASWGSLCAHIGPRQTVYIGELGGISIALDTLLTSAPLLPFPPLEAHFFVDNQAAISNTCDPSPTPGQSLRLHIRSQLQQISISLPSTSIFFHWCPGHVRIEGNERAEEEAKAGAWASILEEEAVQRAVLGSPPLSPVNDAFGRDVANKRANGQGGNQRVFDAQRARIDISRPFPQPESRSALIADFDQGLKARAGPAYSSSSCLTLGSGTAV